MLLRAALIAGLAVFAVPSFAATDLPVPPFTQIEAHGGAKVILKHGSAQKVVITRGDLKVSQIHVVDGRLDINACPYTCPFLYKLEVEIVSPNIQTIEAHGGGAVDARGNFPKQAQLDVVAHGGGAVDARAIPADHVSATAHGGGAVRVNPLVSLNATAHGGGAITYSGNPKVTSSVHGGGAVAKD
jgi:hypothetical protein